MFSHFITELPIQQRPSESATMKSRLD